MDHDWLAFQRIQNVSKISPFNSVKRCLLQQIKKHNTVEKTNNSQLQSKNDPKSFVHPTMEDIDLYIYYIVCDN